MTTITKQIHFAIKNRRKTAMPGPAPESTGPVGRTPRVSKLMALAIRFDQLLRDGKVTDQSELARLAHVTQPRMTQIMNLLHLAPDIQEQLLHLPPVDAGRDPVTERDLRFIVRPYDGFSVGLFIEHRENRRRIRELAAGRRVLNAFAYTCGFSVAAARGGGASVDSIDLSKRYLEWGKQNFTLNGIDTANPTPGKESQSSVLSSKETCSGPRHHQPGLPGHRFFCCDIFDFYKRASRQDRRYDLIILDPPTLSRTRRPKRVFVLEGQLGPLLAGAIDRIEPGGLILLATNHRQISRPRLEEELTTAARAQDRACTITERPTLPPDFAGDPDYAKSVIAHVD